MKHHDHAPSPDRAMAIESLPVPRFLKTRLPQTNLVVSRFLAAIVVAIAFAPPAAFSQACTGLCLQQTTCSGKQSTTISGTVYAPNGTDPLPGVLVYVPNGPVLQFAQTVGCSLAGEQATGLPLVYTTTGPDGTFTLYNMPAGSSIPLVIQAGRWRRQLLIPNVASCVNTALAPNFAVMPANQSQGDIPRIAIVTGSASALECTLRKIGISDSEFTNPLVSGGNGRVNIYAGNDPGATIDGNTPNEAELWSDPNTLNLYDMVFFACQGHEIDQAAQSQQNVINYTNSGGRVFAEHYGYVWLFNDIFALNAMWDVNQNVTFANDPGLATIQQGPPELDTFAQWMQIINPSGPPNAVSVSALEKDTDSLLAGTQPWLTVNDPSAGNVAVEFTFDTPISAQSQCGRVQFNDYHVEPAGNGVPPGTAYPNECSNAPLTPGERALEFALFNLPTQAQLPQTITYPSIPDQNVSAQPFTITATASSGLFVSFQSTTPTVCGTSGNLVTLLAPGQCTITATQAGNANYLPASASQSFQVTGGSTPQTITFNPLPNVLPGAPPFTISATASSGLPVTLTSLTPSSCMVQGTTVMVAAPFGQCSIQATQAGNATYATAAPVTQSFQIGTLQPQTITFNSLPNVPAGAPPFTISASASSGLPVTFTSVTPNVCMVTGNLVQVMAPSGTCTIQATQPGNGTYSAATPVVQSFSISSGSTPQSITFPSLPASAPLSQMTVSLSAKSSSGLTVTFVSDTPATCNVQSGPSPFANLVAVGACTIEADQGGNSTYAAATPVMQTFQITPGTQTISFGSLPNEMPGAPPFQISAKATSGLTVIFASQTPSTCSVAGNIVTLLASSGQCTIQATQPGNANYQAAPPVTQSFQIGLPQPQFISFGALFPVTMNSAPFPITATASSGLAVTFVSDTPATCMLGGTIVNIVTVLNVGTCTIEADQAGNASYQPATPVMQSFQISQGTQTITFPAIAEQPLSIGSITPPAKTSSLLAVILNSQTPSVCSTSGATVALVTKGTCTIQASQPGNANFAAAAPVTQSFKIVTRAPQTITFTPVPAQQLGGQPIQISATASSGLPVSFTENTSTCSVSGNTVTLLSTGKCTIEAYQPGDAQYDFATGTLTFQIEKIGQTIDFAPVSDQTLESGPVTLSATATSGLTVKFSTLSSKTCSVSGDTLTLIATGACTIRATQAGNAAYQAAPIVEQIIQIAQ